MGPLYYITVGYPPHVKEIIRALKKYLPGEGEIQDFKAKYNELGFADDLETVLNDIEHN
jgi:hypothetical protein